MNSTDRAKPNRVLICADELFLCDEASLFIFLPYLNLQRISEYALFPADEKIMLVLLDSAKNQTLLLKTLTERDLAAVGRILVRLAAEVGPEGVEHPLLIEGVLCDGGEGQIDLLPNLELHLYY